VGAQPASGQVEAAFEGEPSAVEAMVDYCGRGPLGASVRDVQVTAEPPAGETGFLAG
jgi:acylphosphatase